MTKNIKRITGIVIISSFVIWFSLLELYLSVGFLLTAAVLAFKFPEWVQPFRIASISFLLLLFVSGEFFYRMDDWGQRARSDRASISDANLGGLYILHGVMTFTGFIPFPEVGREAFFLQFGDGSSRRWEKDLSLISRKLEKLARFHESKLTRIGQSKRTALGWKMSELNSYSEIRVALAVSCQRAFLETKKVKGGFSHSAFCHVSYPNSRMQLGRIGKHVLRFDEGLFLLMEKKGWFRPYDIRWDWDSRTP